MTLQTTETVIGHWVTIIKAHEKLLIVAIAALTLVHFGDKAYDLYGKHLTNQQTAINTQIATVEKSNADLAVKLGALKASVDASAKISQAKIVAAKQTLVINQKLDAALPLPDLSKHWESLLILPEGSITPQPNGTVAVTTDAAHATVNELEKIAPLTAELSATEDQLKGCNDIRTQQDATITGLNTSIGLEKDGRAADAKVAKHDIHKAYMRGFKHGFIVGVVVSAVSAFAILK
jgi:hypothetical protein